VAYLQYLENALEKKVILTPVKVNQKCKRPKNSEYFKPVNNSIQK